MTHWFLPQTPDVLGMLRAQTVVTIEGLDALVAWTRGEDGAADHVRECEHRADEQKRELRRALTEAFTTPLEPEDLFALSVGIDDVMNRAKDTVREAEVMGIAPDAAMAEMADRLVAGSRELVAAMEALGSKEPSDATDAADRAVKHQRRLEHVYRTAMSALVEEGDLREVTARRELYRRLSRTSEAVIGVAERVWYAVLKQG